MRIRTKVWVEQNSRVLFGHGRLELLEAIIQTGSLAGAAKKLDMSYRAAWGRLKASETRLGFPLVEHAGQGRRQANLTPQALELLRQFHALETSTLDYLRQAGEELVNFIQRQAAQSPAANPNPDTPE